MEHVVMPLYFISICNWCME